MPHYKGALEAADNACVFYSPHAMEVKRMPPLSAGAIVDGFQKKGLTVLTDSSDLEMWIERNRPEHDNLLLMSSGTFDGLDALKVAQNWIK
jgi:UDP-N-acetylmuramate: L-alanyl-gamma-D-glutamyl-meso-diaminopimelate ligase